MNKKRYSRGDELIVKTHPKSPVAEAYRSLRTSLNYINPDDPLQTLLVTSSGAGEGKSFMVSNLALAIAQNDKKVIVVDADMRKPMQHKFFNMTNFTGLSNILMGEVDLEEGLRETDISKVNLISTGVIPPNPAELLDSKSMQKVIDKLEEKADMVIVDAPPVIPVTDAALLSKHVDGVLLVVASHETDKDILKKTVEKLNFVKANIIGTVLNKYPIDKNGYYNEYYYYGSSRSI